MDAKPQGDFLSRDEILDIFAKFAKAQKKDDDKSKKKKADDDEDGHYKQRFPGEVVWIKNTEFNENI